MARLTWLGTGSAFNAADGNTASLLEVGDNTILLDCGFTVPYRLKQLGLINAVTHVFLSHTHSDHVGGLELLAQWRYFVAQRQGVPVPKLIVPKDLLDRLRLLEQLGLGAIQDEFGRPLGATLETYFDLGSDWDQHHFSNGAETVSVRHIKTSHVPGKSMPSYGFEILLGENGSPDRMVLLTADSRDVHPPQRRMPLSGIGDRYDLVFHDCQLFESAHGGAGDVHPSLAKLTREIPAEDRQFVWLTHYGENWREHEDLAKHAGFAGFARPDMAFAL